MHKDWTATGGSRADAVVDLSYEFINEEENPVVDEAQTLELAKKRCLSWGYADAEAFGGVKKRVVAVTRKLIWGQQTRIVVTKSYQCLGQGSETPHK